MICYRFHLFILLDNIKSRTGCLHGHIPNGVKHVYLCLSYFMHFCVCVSIVFLCVSLLCWLISSTLVGISLSKCYLWFVQQNLRSFSQFVFTRLENWHAHLSTGWEIDEVSCWHIYLPIWWLKWKFQIYAHNLGLEYTQELKMLKLYTLASNLFMDVSLCCRWKGLMCI